MGIFNFKKKSQDCGCQTTIKVPVKEKCSCGCDKSQCQPQSGLRVKILGGGCAKCNELEQVVIQALDELSIEITPEHVTDFAKIAAYGVMSTPALVVDEKVVCFGKVLKKDEAVSLLQVLK